MQAGEGRLQVRGAAMREELTWCWGNMSEGGAAEIAEQQ